METMMVCPVCGRGLDWENVDQTTWDGQHVVREWRCNRCKCVRVREVEI